MASAKGVGRDPYLQVRRYHPRRWGIVTVKCRKKIKGRVEMGEERDEASVKFTGPVFNSQYLHGGSQWCVIRRPLLVTTGIAHLWRTYIPG